MSDDVSDSTDQESALEQDGDALLEVTDDEQPAETPKETLSLRNDNSTVEDLGTEQPELSDAEFEQLQDSPVPTEVSSVLYRTYAERTSEDESARLQSLVGDRMWHLDQEVSAVMEEFPQLEADEAHIGDDGHLTREGVEKLEPEVFKLLGVNNRDELRARHPRFVAILDDHTDEIGTLSMNGQLLATQELAHQCGCFSKFTGRRT